MVFRLRLRASVSHRNHLESQDRIEVVTLPFVDSTFLQAYLPLSKAQWSQLFQPCRYSVPRLNSLRAFPQVLATAPHKQGLRFCFISAIRGSTTFFRHQPYLFYCRCCCILLSIFYVLTTESAFFLLLWC